MKALAASSVAIVALGLRAETPIVLGPVVLPPFKLL